MRYSFNRAPLTVAAFSNGDAVPRHGPDCLLTLGAAVPSSDLCEALGWADAGTLLVMLGIPFASLCLVVLLIQRVGRWNQ